MINPFRTLSLGSLLALGASGLGGCLTQPDISTTPEISLKEIRLIHVDNPGQILDVDTLVTVINFKDGDGDLGLTTDDQEAPPYNTEAYKYNYYFQLYYKQPGMTDFVLFVPTFDSTNQLFNFLPLPEDRDKKTAKKGELGYKLELPLENEFSPGTEVRATISITDRALHHSNEITTPSVVLGI